MSWRCSSFAPAGLDPVAAVATDKLASTFGSGSATLAFQRAGKIERSTAPSALAAAHFAATLAPVIGFYDSVFGPGAGCFCMIGFVVHTGFGLTRAMAGARFANFGSNIGSLAV